MKRVLFFFLLILSIHFINAQPLSQRLDALLHEEVLKTSEVGIAVFDLTAGESVYRYQDDKLYRTLLTHREPADERPQVCTAIVPGARSG